MLRASLVIPTRNRAAALDRTLTALAAQTEPGFEVVVADDGSDDDTRDVARRHGERLDLRYIRRAHRGIAAARSAAMRAARADVSIQTDDDRLCDPRFVADHVAAHAGGAWIIAGQQRAIHAESITAAMLGAAQLAATLAAGSVDEPWWTSYAAPILARCGLDLDGFAFPWTVAVGGNTSVPRALAEQVGFLDERFVGWGLEDTGFHFRLCEAGARVRVIDGGTSYHQLHERGPERAREWMQNARRLLDKHASLALCLYVDALRRQTPILTASDEANAIASTATPAAIAELIRVHRERIRAEV